MDKQSSQSKTSVLSPSHTFYPDISEKISIYLPTHGPINTGLSKNSHKLSIQEPFLYNDLVSSNSLQRAKLGALRNITFVRPLPHPLKNNTFHKGRKASR